MRGFRPMGGAAALAVALTACTGAPAPSAAPPTPAQAALNWADCRDGFQCTTIEVLEDWNAPDGEKITLAMTKMPATVTRTGTMFVNWGGPGDPGNTSIRTRGEAIAKATGDTMDLITWDPRGLAASTPISCSEGNMQYFEADPATAEGLRSMADAAQQRTAACTARYGSYLALLGTVQGVRDLEAMRIAAGEPVLNFLGLSYGTRIGATYAAMFPGTVGNMVLDGSMSQKGTVRDTAFGMVRAGQDSLDRWFARCAAKPDCAFGPDPGAGYDALFAKVRAEQPVVPGTDGKRLTAGLLYQVVLAGLVDYGGSQQAAEQAVAAYRTKGDPSGLYALGVGIAGQKPDGTFSNGPEIFQYVSCADWPTRLTFAELQADTAEGARSAAHRGVRRQLRPDEHDGVPTGEGRPPAPADRAGGGQGAGDGERLRRRDAAGERRGAALDDPGRAADRARHDGPHRLLPVAVPGGRGRRHADPRRAPGRRDALQRVTAGRVRL
jgi:pimeloyl-ACP methyl ester carboxylesterase